MAEGVEAWGFRAIQRRGEFMSRSEVAEAWLREDYEPIVAALRDAGLIGDQSETQAYMQTVSERYLLMRTHAWDTGVLDRVARQLR